MASALIDKCAVEEIVHGTGIDRGPETFSREPDALDLGTGKDQDRGADRFGAAAGELLLFDRMDKANSILFIAFDMDPGVRPQAFHLPPANGRCALRSDTQGN